MIYIYRFGSIFFKKNLMVFLSSCFFIIRKEFSIIFQLIIHAITFFNCGDYIIFGLWREYFKMYKLTQVNKDNKKYKKYR